MWKKYKKKPVVIEAVLWNGSNYEEIRDFTLGKCSISIDTRCQYPNPCPVVLIPTLEGTMAAMIGDYIIKDVNGEYYTCKPDVFAKTYEEVE